MIAGSPAGAGAGVQIDWCPADRIGDLAAFIGTSWKRDHILSRDLELLAWQHPAPQSRADAMSVLTATLDDEIVAILGVIEFELCDRGAVDRGAWLTTWAAPRLPGHPHLGLRLLERVLEEDYGMVGTLAGNELTQRILATFGFEIRDDTPRWVRVVDAERARPLLGEHARAAPPVAPPTEPIELAAWSNVAAVWEEAWTTSFAPSFAGTCRSAAFVERRYARHPRFRYEIRVPMRDGRPAGLLVYRLEQVAGADVAIARAVEFLALPDAADSVAGALVGLVAADGAALVDFYCTSEAAGRPLEGAGFRLEQEGCRVPSRFQPLDPTPRPLTGAFRWREKRPLSAPEPYFTRSDCDQDRPN